MKVSGTDSGTVQESVPESVPGTVPEVTGVCGKIGGVCAQYDGWADVFRQAAEDGAFNAHYDRPAVLALAGEVPGLQVLDAGCGPGIYAEGAGHARRNGGRHRR